MKEKSVRGAITVAACGAVDTVVRLFAMAILARMLVPEDFGLVAMATAFTAVVDGFRDLGLRSATIQRQEISHQQISNLFWLNAAAGVGFTLLFWGFAPAIGSFYGDERVVPITAVIATAFIWRGFSAQHEALIGRQLRQGELALIGLAANAISVAAAIGGALAGLGFWALVLREVLRSALIAGAVWTRCPWIPAWPRRKSGTADLVRFGRDLSVIQVLYVIVANADRIVLGKLFGASIVGQYRMAQQLILAPIEELDAPIRSVATPALCMLQEDPERYARYYRKMVAFVGLGTMPVAAFGIVYAEELTRVVLGESWRGAEIYIRIFAASAFIRPVLGTAGMALLSLGRTQKLVVMTAVSNVTFLALLALGTKLGPQGVALAYFATAALLLVPNLLFAFANSPLRIGMFFEALRGPALASLLMLGGLVAFRSALPGWSELVALCAGLIAGLLIYVAGLLVQPGSRRQLNALFGDVRETLRPGRPTAHGSDQ